jgi:hypothetical protein
MKFSEVLAGFSESVAKLAVEFHIDERRDPIVAGRFSREALEN